MLPTVVKVIRDLILKLYWQRLLFVKMPLDAVKEQFQVVLVVSVRVYRLEDRYYFQEEREDEGEQGDSDEHHDRAHQVLRVVFRPDVAETNSRQCRKRIIHRLGDNFCLRQNSIRFHIVLFYKLVLRIVINQVIHNFAINEPEHR